MNAFVYHNCTIMIQLSNNTNRRPVTFLTLGINTFTIIYSHVSEQKFLCTEAVEVTIATVKYIYDPNNCTVQRVFHWIIIGIRNSDISNLLAPETQQLK